LSETKMLNKFRNKHSKLSSECHYC